MGSNFVGHNTGEMRNWSDDMGNLSQEYDNLIRSLYNLVDNFVAADFTGGLSTQFQSTVMAQRDHLNGLTEFLQEVSDCIKQTSSIIDRDEEDLTRMMNSSSLF